MIGDDLFRRRRLLPTHRQRLLGDGLQRVDVVKVNAVNFVNVGVWNSRAEFYAHFGVEPGSVPERQPFEVADRRREWLLALA